MYEFRLQLASYCELMGIFHDPPPRLLSIAEALVNIMQKKVCLHELSVSHRASKGRDFMLPPRCGSDLRSSGSGVGKELPLHAA
jgi:hypothetical protein